MNKKGFTLVELLAVIALVAILSGIAVTNVVSSINNSKKNAFLLDAKRMISKAEYLMSSNKDYRTIVQNSGSTGLVFQFNDYELNGKIIKGLNEKNEFQKDADDGEFDTSSFVKVTKSNSSYNYCVCMIGSKRKIGDNCNTSSATCIEESQLTGIDKVTDK